MLRRKSEETTLVHVAAARNIKTVTEEKSDANRLFILKILRVLHNLMRHSFFYKKHIKLQQNYNIFVK